MDQRRQQELIDMLQGICEELGWVVGIPSDDDSTKVPGLIIGLESFVYQVVEAYTDDYEIYTKNPGDENMTELPTFPSMDKKKKDTVH